MGTLGFFGSRIMWIPMGQWSMGGIWMEEYRHYLSWKKWWWEKWSDSKEDVCWDQMIIQQVLTGRNIFRITSKAREKQRRYDAVSRKWWSVLKTVVILWEKIVYSWKWAYFWYLKHGYLDLHLSPSFLPPTSWFLWLKTRSLNDHYLIELQAKKKRF